jgi:hypothetical protein
LGEKNKEIMNKIKFNSNYSPYTKGQIVVVDARAYNFYLSLGVASVHDECNCNKDVKKKCSDCEKAKEVIIETPAVVVEEVIEAPIKKAVSKKAPTKKKRAAKK